MHITRIAAVITLGLSLIASREARGALNFNFLPDAGTPQYVLDGFAAAANQWSAALANNVTINIEIGWVPLPSGVIGQTSYPLFTSDYQTVSTALGQSATSVDDRSAYAALPTGSSYTRLINRTTDNPNGSGSATVYVNSLAPVAMTRANARALGFLSSDHGADASIRFGSGVPFDFDPSNGITSGQYDFTRVAMHEIGHALGFVSAVNSLEQGAGTAESVPSSILDLFRFSSQSYALGRGVTDCAADSRDKFFSVDGGATIAGPFSAGVLGDGYQAGHWRAFYYTGLMDPTVFTGPGGLRGLSPTDLRAFDVIGFTIPEPSAAALLFVAFGAAAWVRCRKERV